MDKFRIDKLAREWRGARRRNDHQQRHHRGRRRDRAAVLNSGVINASGGELDLAGTGNTNMAAGISGGGGIPARSKPPPAGRSIYLQGLATNNGTSLSAAEHSTITTIQWQMPPARMILGSGTLKTGGLTNAGSVYFADNPTSVFGSVATTMGGVFTVTNNTTTFFGAVTVGTGSTFTVNTRHRAVLEHLRQQRHLH